MLLSKLGQGHGYLKAGFLGFQKSGKTYSAALLAIGTRKFFEHDGPIAMFDTEGGSEYVAAMIKEASGEDLVGIKSRSFADLMVVGQECIDSNVSVLVVDSITHVWRELCAAHLDGINKGRQRRGLSKRAKMEFQDWAAVKDIWSKWTDFYLNSPLHIIICGRAGFEYDFEKDDEGKKELVKTGVKMKVEGEFGFEPSLLVEMEREQVPFNNGFRIRRKATVLGDRFAKIDGSTCFDPTFDFFLPHLLMLKPGALSKIDTSVKTHTGSEEDGDSDWQRERKTRVIICEEIQGELVNSHPGQTAADKKAKTDLIFDAFGTRSWTAVESMSSDRLRNGLAAIREKLHPTPHEEIELPDFVTSDRVAPQVEESMAGGSETEYVTDSGSPHVAHLSDKMTNQDVVGGE